MKRALHSSLLLMVSVWLILGDCLPVQASGTYRPASVRGSKRTKIDTTKYIAGKKIFLGTAVLSARPQATKLVLPRLIALQKALPKTLLARTKNVTRLSGKLTSQQMEALEYYASIRFRVRLKKKC